MDARIWLRTNGYDEIADLIDEIIRDWQQTGNGTRRNWWEKLAGRVGGESCIVAGKHLPVLRAAQIRQGKPITANSICHNEHEEIPLKRITGRWKSNSIQLPLNLDT